MRKSHTILVRSLIDDMDALIAHYTTVLWKHRANIHQYDQNVGLLFRTIDVMMDDPRASYHGYMGRLFEDIGYADSLLPGMVDFPHQDRIYETDESLGRIEHLYHVWGVIIAVMTCGLYLLWKQPLYTT